MRAESGANRPLIYPATLRGALVAAQPDFSLIFGIICYSTHAAKLRKAGAPRAGLAQRWLVRPRA